jgi:DNA-binding XRE family transcriptional regulator
MNKKHIGRSVLDTVKGWEEKYPGFRERVNEQIEKRKLAAMLKEIRKKEHLTQKELAEKANVTQSVVARIEGGTGKALPRFDLFNKLVQAAGYELSIHAKKNRKHVQVALSG